MKRVCSIVLSLLTLLCALAASSLPSAAENTGKCGDGLVWTLEDGVLTISGSGPMYDFGDFDRDAPWFDDMETITGVIVGSGVTSIGDAAFLGSVRLTSVSLPASLLSIGWAAFGECTALKSLAIPGKVKEIGRFAFAGCTGLTNLVLPDSVTSLGKGAFNACAELKTLTIGKNMRFIGELAFAGCTKLRTVYFTGSLAQWCGIQYDYNALEDGTAAVAGPCGNGAALYIGGRLLTDAVIPSSATALCWGTFTGCSSLRSITIPESVALIDLKTFENCAGLSDIYYAGSKEQWEETVCDHYHSDVDWNSITVHYDSPFSDVPGDTNGDSCVNKKDSLLLGRYLADNTCPISLGAADVNNDGFVNKKDQLRLRQYLAGWRVMLGA